MDLVEVLPQLQMLRFPIGQAYLWRDGAELTLIDAGDVTAAPAIEATVRGLGPPGSFSPTAIATITARPGSSRTGTAPTSWPTVSSPR